jgi:hypothetical protein
MYDGGGLVETDCLLKGVPERGIVVFFAPAASRYNHGKNDRKGTVTEAELSLHIESSALKIDS